MSRQNNAHYRRVASELRRVGLTERGMKKFSKRSIYEAIHPEEHIMGAAYGRYGAGSFNWYEGMLVASDSRLLFFDLTPGVSDFTELTYDAVTGIEHMTVGPFTSIVLYTAIKDYGLRFVNPRSANILVHYIEQRRLEDRVDLRPSVHESRSDNRDNREDGKR